MLAAWRSRNQNRFPMWLPRMKLFQVANYYATAMPTDLILPAFWSKTREEDPLKLNVTICQTRWNVMAGFALLSMYDKTVCKGQK